MKPVVVATLALDPDHLAMVRDALGDIAEVIHLPDVAPDARAGLLAGATALLSRHTGTELLAGEAALVRRARIVQFINAGLDFVPLNAFAADVPIASNRGAYAGPIAEHAMAMYLASSKRLLVEHEAMRRGEFNQFTMNTAIAGKTCAILGLGGIGGEIARLSRAFGMRVHGINRRGQADVPVDRIGTLANLDDILAGADVLMVCAPLTSRTRGLIGARELALMKVDATIVNLARGEIIDEAALYRRLVQCPHFKACIEAWWVEPTRHGAFRLQHPFFDLPNFLGSPHNSASVPGSVTSALARAVQNVRNVLLGAPPQYLVPPDERAAASAGAP